jgi:glucose/arabinose dehydrogenase
VDGKYGIPPENPYSTNTQGFRREIFAFGLRNPWRFSFDPETGDLWIADVGQNQFEEVNFLKYDSPLYNASKNYGWPIMEGFHCFGSENCDMTGFIQPVWEYSHTLGRSITGGYVYRGTRTPSLSGKYLYADYAEGLVWTLENPEAETPANNQIFETNLFISSFGLDENNEIYVCGINNGKIYRF